MARGHIEKRGKDTFRINIELDPDPATGRRRIVRETFHGTPKEAEKRRTDMLSAADRGELVVNTKTTVAEYLAQWLADYASGRAPKTKSIYVSFVRLYVVPHLGKVTLAKLTPAQIVRWLAILRDVPRTDGKEGKLAPSTISATFRMLHTALNCAVKWQLISRNPMGRVDHPSVPRREMKSYDVQQAQAFLAAS